MPGPARAPAATARAAELAWLGPPVLAVAATIGAGILAWRAMAPALALPSTAGVDLLPWYLGAHALAAGQDPGDPEVLRRIFDDLDLRLRVGGFFNYYPATASLWVFPARGVPFAEVVPAFRAVLAACLVGGAGIGAYAGAVAPGHRPRWPWLLLVASGAVALVALLRFTPGILRTAQPGPVVLLLTALGLAALARGRERTAGAFFGLGAATKLLPLPVLVAAALHRQWRVVIAATLVLAAGTAATAALGAPIGGVDLVSLRRFVDPPLLPTWQASPPWMLALWSARLWLGVPTAGLVLLSAWRRRALPSAAALVIATIGAALAGSHHSHEAIQLVPALAWLVGWPAHPTAPRGAWLAPLAAVGAIALGGALRPGPMATLDLLPGAWAVWAGCAARLLWELPSSGPPPARGAG